ncbi:uncharacterized protein A4U43_C07F28120 [Asparagus officinalis]|uniref:Uncharacterized protein n=1 Tax=Asparagus officinalis TaxID=4686 RepID=A0A5P1EFF7_ASPOF|nr:uncharacterized protein A4U43_C07F28120 [Asparagus officinalis]
MMVPESVVQTISQKFEQELTKKFEAQKADLVHGFVELLIETLGQTIDPTAIARLVARTTSPEEANSTRNRDRPQLPRSSHHPLNEACPFRPKVRTWLGVQTGPDWASACLGPWKSLGFRAKPSSELGFRSAQCNPHRDLLYPTRKMARPEYPSPGLARPGLVQTVKKLTIRPGGPDTVGFRLSK